MSIDITTYPTLNSYTVLAGTAITASVFPAQTIIENGSYASDPTPTYTGNLVGTLNQFDAPAAQLELTTLISDIGLIPGGTNIGTTIVGPQTYTPGKYFSNSAITFTSGSTITLQGGPSDQFFFIAESSITFTTVSSIILTGGVTTCNVFWLAKTGSITFNASPPPIIPGILIAGASITFAAASQIAGRTYAKAAITFLGNTGVNAICTADPEPIIICYLKGTLILTKQGFVPIEDIKAGQQVVTKGKIYKNKFVKTDAEPQLEPVFWVSKFKVVDLNSKSRPICIKKDALGENRPFKDLYVSPGHSLLLNGRMVLAKNIVNGKTIYQDKECDNIEYYHLECERHSAIFANGVLSESYLDVNNRDVFENSVRLTRKFDLKKLNFLKK